jgi:hypothetical protein
MGILDRPPGTQLEVVRRPETGLLGWLTRAQDHLLRRAKPEMWSPVYVRGARIAIDYLVEALLRYADGADFTFAVDDSRIAAFQRWARDASYSSRECSSKSGGCMVGS